MNTKYEYKDKDNTKIQTRRKTEIQNTQSQEYPNSRFPPQNYDDDDFQSELRTPNFCSVEEKNMN